jgi:hypothetical protein
MRWRVLAILLWWPLFLAQQAGASGPDPNRPIKQMRHASWNEASGLSGDRFLQADLNEAARAADSGYAST